MGSVPTDPNMIKWKDGVEYIEEIPIGGGIDDLSAPTKLSLGRHSEVRNLLLDKEGSYVQRNPYTVFDMEHTATYGIEDDAGPPTNNATVKVTDQQGADAVGRFVIGIWDPAEIGIGGELISSYEELRITGLWHYKRHDGKQCYIVVGDNNASAATYVCAVFKVNLDGTNPMNISMDQVETDGAIPGALTVHRRFYTGTQEEANGCDRGIYWRMQVFTDPQSGRDVLIMTNGATLPQVWDVDDPEVADPVQLRNIGYPEGTTPGDWTRPDPLNGAGTDCTITPTSSGYLYGKYFYKFIWMTRAAGGGTRHRSPASIAWPTTGALCNGHYNAMANLPSRTDADLEIYRTKGDGNTFYYAGAVSAGGGATYNDKKPDRDLGIEISNIGDPPEAGYRECAVYNGRLYLGNRRLTSGGALSADTTARWAERIIYSDVGYYESFRKDYSDLQLVHQFASGKYDPINYMWANEDALFAWKQDSMWALQGYDPASYGKFDISCIDYERGCSAGNTVVIVNGKPEWLWQKEWLRFNGLRPERVYKLSERTLNKISLTNIHKACAVKYPHKNCILFCYTHHLGSTQLDASLDEIPTTPTWNNRMILMYYENQEWVNIECIESDNDVTEGGWGAENKTFGAMAEVETENKDFERIMLGESDEAIGGYLYRWDQAQAIATGAASTNHRDCPSGDTETYGYVGYHRRQFNIRKEIITDWLDQNSVWLRKQYNYLALVCKTNNDEASGATGDSRSSLKFQGFVDGKYDTATPAWPMDATASEFPYKQVRIAKSGYDYVTLIVALADPDASGYIATNDLKNMMGGNMAKFRIFHNTQGYVFELHKLYLFYSPAGRIDWELYNIVAP